jgi:hypothetical protein
MTGLSNYTANNFLNWVTGQEAEPSLPAVYLALYTAVGTDAGTGFTEVSGGAYARVQVAGALTASASFTTSSTTITLSATVPAWVVAGMSIYVTLTTTASHASSGSADSLTFSAFGTPSGTAPATITNTAAITFAQATASWGTVIAWGLYDALTSGDLLMWDFMGNYAWLPFENPTGSNPTFSVKANGYSSNDPVVLTAEYGGTLPSLSTGTFTSYTVNYVASPATDAISLDTTSGPTTAVVATSSGSGMLRKITQQSIPANVTASFAASSFTINAS